MCLMTLYCWVVWMCVWLCGVCRGRVCLYCVKDVRIFARPPSPSLILRHRTEKSVRKILGCWWLASELIEPT